MPAVGHRRATLGHWHTAIGGEVDFAFADPYLDQEMWRRREIENYVCQRSALLAFAEARGREQHGDLFGPTWRTAMGETVDEIAAALTALGKPDPWSADLKASEEFLDPLFKRFYAKLDLPNLMSKTDYHTLAPFVDEAVVDPEVQAKLDRIVEVAQRARPGQAERRDEEPR